MSDRFGHVQIYGQPTAVSAPDRASRSLSARPVNLWLIPNSTMPTTFKRCPVSKSRLSAAAEARWCIQIRVSSITSMHVSLPILSIHTHSHGQTWLLSVPGSGQRWPMDIAGHYKMIIILTIINKIQLATQVVFDNGHQIYKPVFWLLLYYTYSPSSPSLPPSLSVRLLYFYLINKPQNRWKSPINSGLIVCLSYYCFRVVGSDRRLLSSFCTAHKT